LRRCDDAADDPECPRPLWDHTDIWWLRKSLRLLRATEATWLARHKALAISVQQRFDRLADAPPRLFEEDALALLAQLTATYDLIVHVRPVGSDHVRPAGSDHVRPAGSSGVLEMDFLARLPLFRHRRAPTSPAVAEALYTGRMRPTPNDREEHRSLLAAALEHEGIWLDRLRAPAPAPAG